MKKIDFKDWMSRRRDPRARFILEQFDTEKLPRRKRSGRARPRRAGSGRAPAAGKRRRGR
jgi:hypothetical protein